MTSKYRHSDLTDCATELFTRAGADPGIAEVMAEVLVEADLLGYTTHGLLFATPFVEGLESGSFTPSGLPEFLKESSGTMVVDGRWLPGQWVMTWTLGEMLSKAQQVPVVTAVVRRAQNIACLAVYARRLAMRGLVGMVMASAPANEAVAPHGGKAPRYSTNPLAMGIPAPDHPILIDTSTSSASNREVERNRRAGTRLAHPSLVSNKGKASTDPAVMLSNPPGAILPAGGMDWGHKGFAFGLMVEALTSCLGGFGRGSLPEAKGNNIFVQVIDPDAFGGRSDLLRETGHLGEHLRNTPPQKADQPVRVPGDRAAAAYEEQTSQGVALHPEIMPRLEPLLKKYKIKPPKPV